MKGKFGVSLLLCGTMVLSPALGAEGGSYDSPPPFSDVEAGSRYEEGVRVCVEAGLMKGTGAGMFSPNGIVTNAEAVTIAARIHHIKNGGDGNLPHAPEDWGLLKVAFEDGTIMTLDGSQYRRYPAPMSSVFGAEVRPEQLAGLEWFSTGDAVPVTLTAETLEPLGPVKGLAYWNDYNGTRDHIRLRTDDKNASAEEQKAFQRMETALCSVQRPEPGNWFRDAKYYLETVGLTEHYVLDPYDPHHQSSTRSDFATALSYVSEGFLEPLNHITDYPDSPPASSSADELKNQVLSLYNAGILTGKDEFGTFDGAGTLTRAECAAMAARVVKPSLRLRFQPTPVPEKYRYELTYLMDDPMESHIVTYPVCPIFSPEGEHCGILTLDGKLIPWPGGEEPVDMRPQGYYYYMSFWFTQPDGSRVEKGGLIDKTGTFVVPLTAGCYRAKALEDASYLTQDGAREGGAVTLWDKEGNPTPLGSMNWSHVEEQYPSPMVERWQDIHTHYTGCYVDKAGHPVSESFDWVGSLTDDGRGFVGLDGKIYRIEFE